MRVPFVPAVMTVPSVPVPSRFVFAVLIVTPETRGAFAKLIVAAIA